MAMKVPIVSTNCDGVIEIVVDKETGIQVPPRDAHALSDALVRLIQDEQLRRRLGEAGRRRVEKMFDLRQRTNALEKLYARVLDRTSDMATAVVADRVEKPA
jgi:glycosyltransferase involved in cell wall biosynthesis